MGVNAISTTDLFDANTKTLCVGYDNVTFIFNFIGDRLGSLVADPIPELCGRPVESFLHLVQSPFGIFPFGESIPEMVLFLLQQLRIAVKESIYIRVNNLSLNNNIGKFNLSHIWDRVLLNTRGLT